MGALACYLATCSGKGHLTMEGSLEDFLKKAGAVATHTVKARGTQASYNVDLLRSDLLMSHHAKEN